MNIKFVLIKYKLIKKSYPVTVDYLVNVINYQNPKNNESGGIY